MTNSEELRKVIHESGMKLNYIAKIIGITPFTLTKKIDNVTCFNSIEIAKLCALLGIKSLKQKEKIFFANQDD